VLAPADCDWRRLGATGGDGVLTPSSQEVSGARGSVGGTASKSESCLGAEEMERFIEIA
jgi:hypothetical protein